MRRNPSAQARATMALVELGVSERLFVWGFRAAAQSRRFASPQTTELHLVYDYFGVADAALSLDAMLETFARTAHTPVEIHSPGCPCVSACEFHLLRAAAAAQHGQTDVAREAFTRWLPKTAADWILAPATGLGRVFAESGLVLSGRDAAVVPVHETMAMRSWPVGSAVLH